MRITSNAINFVKVPIFNKLEASKIDLNIVIAFLLRSTNGMVASLWEGVGTESKAWAEGVALGLPTTVVAGATTR